MDAREALKLDSNYVKAYYRRGEAHFALGRYKEARLDFKKVLQLRPNDKDGKAKFKECDKEFRRVMFEQAIQSEHTKSAFECVDIDAMTIDSSYTGPRLPDGNEDTMTVEFVTGMMAWFEAQKCIPVKYLWKILRGCKALFSALPSLVDVPLDGALTQITVCGDTHGQFYDVLQLFKLNGVPSPTNPYLFNGDFVDRGSFSTEVVITFLAFKLLYPNHFFMSRGNHETIAMNRMYGFEGEVRHKYDSKCMDGFTEVFNVLPLAHVINRKVFVVHGGLFTKENVTLDEIRTVSRVCQPPDSGLMSDMLWSDPQPQQGRGPSKRGVGLSFGPDVTKSFLQHNGLELVVRSHEVKPEGYVVEHDGRCITIFSAPNCELPFNFLSVSFPNFDGFSFSDCDQIGNKAAYIIFKADCKPDIRQFDAVPHPKVPLMAYGNSSPFGM
jgi:serine/threonine-protein phosphatase 5